MGLKKQNQDNMKEGVVLAVGEIFLKSRGVQGLLFKKLLENISIFLEREKVAFRIFFFRERIFIETKNFKKISKILKRIFGVVWFASAYFFPKADFSVLNSFIKKNWQTWIKKDESFALRVRKEPEMKESRETIIKKIAQNIKRKVDLENPKREIFIERRKAGWFLYFKKEKGPGGLPVGSQGKVLTLISGGIDSPAAAFFMAKRGAENVWLHFHSFPLVSNKSIEKVKELAKVFLNYQPKLKIYFLPFSEIQMAIKTKIPANYRVLFYRYFMLRTAQILAKEENCEALVTGDSLGQVSSQTLVNLNITQEGLKIPVLRPLIGMDKNEIIVLAKKIKTFEISIKPQEDCCSLFVPKHQTAQAKSEIVKKLKKDLRFDSLISKIIRNAIIFQAP